MQKHSSVFSNPATANNNFFHSSNTAAKQYPVSDKWRISYGYPSALQKMLDISTQNNNGQKLHQELSQVHATADFKHANNKIDVSLRTREKKRNSC